MGDARKALRHRVLKAGTVVFGGGGGITCTVRNLSDTGAALDVTSPVGISDSCVLVLDTETIQRPCRVVWRKEKRIGIVFET